MSFPASSNDNNNNNGCEGNRGPPSTTSLVKFTQQAASKGLCKSHMGNGRGLLPGAVQMRTANRA
eukprot:1604525-Karenia_brevis.AAC.1